MRRANSSITFPKSGQNRKFFVERFPLRAFLESLPKLLLEFWKIFCFFKSLGLALTLRFLGSFVRALTPSESSQEINHPKENESCLLSS